MLGHYDVTDQPKSESVSNSPEDLDESVARLSCPEKRLTAVAAECDEVQMVESVNAFQAFRHDAKPEAPPSDTEDGAPATTCSRMT